MRTKQKFCQFIQCSYRLNLVIQYMTQKIAEKKNLFTLHDVIESQILHFIII